MSQPLSFQIFILISTKAALFWWLCKSCKSHFISLTYIIISFTFIICQCHVGKYLPFRPSMIQLAWLGFDGSLNTIHSFLLSSFLSPFLLPSFSLVHVFLPTYLASSTPTFSSLVYSHLAVIF